MSKPLVSVIIRTCQRPAVLKQALDSIRKQTYKNIQVIVVEDGKNVSERLLVRKYSDLNYVFRATDRKVGRSAAGNLALELAEGEYINFLDDDDILFPDHICKLVDALEKGKNRAAYSNAIEIQINVLSYNPYKYNIKRKVNRYHQPFNRLLLYTFNYIPIQSIMFERKLYEELGGFDINLDALEDWDIWARYSTKTDFTYIDENTSCYFTPYNRKRKKKRAMELDKYNEILYTKFLNYLLHISVFELHQDMKYVMDEYKEKAYMRYLKILFRRIFWGER